MEFIKYNFIAFVTVITLICIVWTALIIIAWSVELVIEHFMEVHARMMERFSFTTNRPKYEYHRDRLRVWGARANKWDHVMDFLTIQ
jgi:hypothetical protein